MPETGAARTYGPLKDAGGREVLVTELDGYAIVQADLEIACTFEKTKLADFIGLLNAVFEAMPDE